VQSVRSRGPPTRTGKRQGGDKGLLDGSDWASSYVKMEASVQTPTMILYGASARGARYCPLCKVLSVGKTVPPLCGRRNVCGGSHCNERAFPLKKRAGVSKKGRSFGKLDAAKMPRPKVFNARYFRGILSKRGGWLGGWRPRSSPRAGSARASGSVVLFPFPSSPRHADGNGNGTTLWSASQTTSEARWAAEHFHFCFTINRCEAGTAVWAALSSNQ